MSILAAIKAFIKNEFGRALYRYVRKHYLGKTGQISFAQFGEDIILQVIFPSKNNGIYLDIGAHHSRRYSNTFALFRRGWRGINIDPGPGAMESFFRDRPNDFNLNIAVGARSGTAELHHYRESTFDTLSTERAQTVGRPNERFEVEIRSLDDIFKDLPIDESQIDFVNIDVEGMDLEILESMNFNKFMPTCICIEIHDFDLLSCRNHPVVKLLSEKGYGLRSYAWFTAIFVREFHEKEE